MSEWEEVKLGKYCKKIGSGATPRGGSSVYSETGEIALIRSQNIYNDGFKEQGLVYITQEAADKLKNVEVMAGDILLNITGDSVARVCLVPEKFLPARVNQHVAIIRPDSKEFDARYIRYYLSSPKLQNLLFTIASSGATRNALTKVMLELLDIPKPSISIQNSISNKLESLDKKIAINQQINQTLEEMAQGVFKSWFVNFEPTRAKMAALAAGGNAQDANLAAMSAISGKSAQELQTLKSTDEQAYNQLHHTATLFPCAMQNSELGEIPEGWEVKQVQDLAKTIKGKSYKSSELKSSPAALVTLKSFNRGGGYRLDGLKEYIGKYKPEQEVFAGDLIIAYTDVTQAADVIGKPAMVISNSKYEHLVISLDVAVVRPEKDELKYFLYGLAKTDQFQQRTQSYSTGTTVLHLSKNAVPEYNFVKPSDTLIEVYRDIAEPLFKSINEKIEENNTLTQIRDALLPKLLSGEIDASAINNKEAV